MAKDTLNSTEYAELLEERVRSALPPDQVGEIIKSENWTYFEAILRIIEIREICMTLATLQSEVDAVVKALLSGNFVEFHNTGSSTSDEKWPLVDSGTKRHGKRGPGAF